MVAKLYATEWMIASRAPQSLKKTIKKLFKQNTTTIAELESTENNWTLIERRTRTAADRRIQLCDCDVRWPSLWYHQFVSIPCARIATLSTSTVPVSAQYKLCYFKAYCPTCKFPQNMLKLWNELTALPRLANSKIVLWIVWIVQHSCCNVTNKMEWISQSLLVDPSANTLFSHQLNMFNLD